MNDPAPPPKVFTPKRRRAFLSFRRRSDLFWFLLSIVMFVFSFTVLVFKVHFEPPEVIERVIEKPSSTLPATPPPETSLSPTPTPQTPPQKQSRAPAALEGFPLFASTELIQKSTNRNAKIIFDARWLDGHRTFFIDYQMNDGFWVQVSQTLPKNVSRYSRVQFDLEGDGSANTIELKLVDARGTTFGTSWPGGSRSRISRPITVPFKDLQFLYGEKKLDWQDMKNIQFAISTRMGDEGGKGRVRLRDFRLL